MSLLADRATVLSRAQQDTPEHAPSASTHYPTRGTIAPITAIPVLESKQPRVYRRLRSFPQDRTPVIRLT